MAGVRCWLETNSELVIGAARESFERLSDSAPSADVTMRFAVDPTATGAPPWPAPYFRGHGHLVLAAFDGENALVVDLLRRRAVGRFSPAVAGDTNYWRRVIFPAVFGIVSETVGVTALHCACVSRGGRGLLLAGDSGSGKSTLSLALARNGFRFVADDWTYFSRSGGRLLAWGLGAPLKLLPSATEFFPELAGLEPELSQNGELAYEFQPEEVFGVERSNLIEPHWLVFLERREGRGVSWSELSPVDVAARLEAQLERLPPAVAGGRDFLVKTIRLLVQRPCWLLQHDARPQAVAQALVERLDDQGTASSIRRGDIAGQPMACPDLLRRFTPTPFAAALHICGRTVRLETNSELILRRARNAFAVDDKTEGAQFHWSIISEAPARPEREEPEIAAFSDDGLSFVNLDGGGFVAVDRESRQAVGFLHFLGDEEFCGRLLHTLFSLSAPALGLTPMRVFSSAL